jgi:uncharacterized protein (DUF924 family)
VSERRAQDVLDFWFGADPMAPDQLAQRMRLWFGGDEPPEIRALRDDSLSGRFGALTQAAAAGHLDTWVSSPHRLLALVLLLDQFPRSIHRGTSAAFAQDDRALELVMAGLQTGADATLTPIQRVFFYMPMQHSESADIQEESVAAFQRLAIEAPLEHRSLFQNCLKFAQLHQRIIARFGRFPHRNGVLQRQSSPAEEAFLRDEAMRFGQ